MRRTWALMAAVLAAGCVGFHPRGVDRSAESPSVVAAPSPPRGEVSSSPWQTIGQSHEGRPLRIRQVGHGPRRVIWVGGIHGNEREGVVSTAELPTALARVAGALDEVTLTILEDVNPDGTAANTRGNARGVDLNRNYPADNFLPGAKYGRRPLDQPEAKAFSERSGYRVKPSDRIHPTPGSLGSWIGRKLQVPILTLEHERGSDPLTCWLDTRDALLAVILSA